VAAAPQNIPTWTANRPEINRVWHVLVGKRYNVDGLGLGGVCGGGGRGFLVLLLCVNPGSRTASHFFW